MGNFKEDIAKIKAFVFDVDGVFTDGKIMPIPGNEFIRLYNAKDGYATKLLTQKGYKVAIITGGRGNMLSERFNMLGVKDQYINCSEKLDALKDFMSKHGLTQEEVLFMGDDIPDVEAMKHAGIAVCPADAAHEVKQAARYVSGYKGGEGCVRDIIEQVLRSQNGWFSGDDLSTDITSA